MRPEILNVNNHIKFNAEELGLNTTLLLEIFTHYCCEELNLLKVKIELNVCDIDDSLRGYVLDEEDDYKVFVRNNMDIDTTCKTIAHELMHVKQFVFNNLREHIQNNSGVDYENTWWEEQAFKGSFKIYKKFVDTKAMEILETGIEIYHEKKLRRNK